MTDKPASRSSSPWWHRLLRSIRRLLLRWRALRWRNWASDYRSVPNGTDGCLVAKMREAHLATQRSPSDGTASGFADWSVWFDPMTEERFFVHREDGVLKWEKF